MPWPISWLSFDIGWYSPRYYQFWSFITNVVSGWLNLLVSKLFQLIQRS